jgi:hypothetical protein
MEKKKRKQFSYHLVVLRGSMFLVFSTFSNPGFLSKAGMKTFSRLIAE